MILRFALLLLLGVAALRAQTPSSMLIPFQGRLTDQQGNPRTNGVYTLIFNLYDQAVGGSNLWTERHEKVGVVNGMVNVFLGSITPLDSPAPGVDFSSTRYLGITVDADQNSNTSDPEMVPRQMIIPAFAAKNSEKLAGADWSSILFSGNNPKTGFLNGAKIQPDSITGAQLRSNSVTFPRLARRRYVERNGSQIGDMAVSQAIHYSTTITENWQIVDKSQVTLNTSGGPVIMSIVPLEGSSEASFNIGAGIAPYGGGYPSEVSPLINTAIAVFVDGSPVAAQTIRTDSNISAARMKRDTESSPFYPYAAQFGAITFVALPVALNAVVPNLPPGEHTFEIRVRSLTTANINTVSIASSRLLVYEP